MHPYTVPESIRARVIRLQGKPFALDEIDAARTALVVVDMQNYYVAEGYPNQSPQARVDRAQHQPHGGSAARGGREGRVDPDRQSPRRWPSGASITGTS